MLPPNTAEMQDMFPPDPGTEATLLGTAVHVHHPVTQFRTICKAGKASPTCLGPLYTGCQGPASLAPEEGLGLAPLSPNLPPHLLQPDRAPARPGAREIRRSSHSLSISHKLDIQFLWQEKKKSPSTLEIPENHSVSGLRGTKERTQ